MLTGQKIEYLYGIQPVLGALRSSFRKIKQLLVYVDPKPKDSYMDDILQLAKKRKILIQYATKSQLHDLCGFGRPHQNVALQVLPLQIPELNRPLLSGLSLLLTDIVDPQNVGSILRSAFFYGVERVYITNGCSELSPIVSKASAGSLEIFANRLFRCGRGRQFMEKAKSDGMLLIAAHSGKTENRPLLPSDLIVDNAIVALGNEGSGLPKSILDNCAYVATITGHPGSLHQGLDSLNVGVATGVLLDRLIYRQSLKTFQINAKNLD